MDRPPLMAVDVVIVHYHAAAAVRDAVAALRADAGESGIPLHVIVADNGSDAAERDLLRSLGVTIVDTGRNAGYAGALDAAWPATRAGIVVVMNEDVVVLPGCLGALRGELESGAAVAGPRFYWDRDCTLVLPCTEERTRRNELAKAGARRDAAKLARARAAWRGHARRHWRSEAAVPSTSLSGALLAFRRDAWDAVGPFDAAFRLYYEENDWLLRIERAGLRSLYVPYAQAMHFHNPTAAQAPERRQWEAESFLRFGNRHYGEHFMRRLLRACAGESVIPQWSAGDVSSFASAARAASGSLWLEITPSPYGFPAAATRLPHRAGCTLPPMRGLEFIAGPLYAQLVDDDGRELSRCRFEPFPPSCGILQPL